MSVVSSVGLHENRLKQGVQLDSRKCRLRKSLFVPATVPGNTEKHFIRLPNVVCIFQLNLLIESHMAENF